MTSMTKVPVYFRAKKFPGCDIVCRSEQVGQANWLQQPIVEFSKDFLQAGGWKWCSTEPKLAFSQRLVEPNALVIFLSKTSAGLALVALSCHAASIICTCANKCWAAAETECLALVPSVSFVPEWEIEPGSLKS